MGDVRFLERMSCAGQAMHAQGECECFFKPLELVELLEKERKWLELFLRVEPIDEGARARWVVLTERARWMRN
jgi:hypothetical protein